MRRWNKRGQRMRRDKRKTGVEELIKEKTRANLNI
jgi:hypothetical protein